MLGLIAAERAEAGRHPAHDVCQDGLLDLRAVDGSAGRLGDGCDGADVVEVAVGDEDGLQLHAQRVDGLQQALGLIAGVDDDRARGLAGVAVGVGTHAHDVAVLLHRADGEGADVEAAHLEARVLLRCRRRYIHMSV